MEKGCFSQKKPIKCVKTTEAKGGFKQVGHARVSLFLILDFF